MIILFVLQEIATIIFYLSLPAFLIYLAYKERKQHKKYFNLVTEVSENMLEKADDERPIMLNVSQEKLIQKTVDEIEKRNQERRA